MQRENYTWRPPSRKAFAHKRGVKFEYLPSNILNFSSITLQIQFQIFVFVVSTMSEDGGPALKRTKLSQDEYEKLNREELLQRLLEQDALIDSLQAKQGIGDQGGEDSAGPKDAEDKLKQQQVEATRRENVLVMRLTTKEQEMQEYLNQIAELKQVRNPATTQLRGMLLDPAINLMFQRMKKEMDSCKEKLEQAQNDLAAWKFTPDSQTGKRLMAKCRMLLQENEELGKMISTGRTAKLEGEIALEKKFVEEMKKSQAETDDFLVEMDEDMEGMQSTIYFLQQQLKDAKDEATRLADENARLTAAAQQPAPADTTRSMDTSTDDQSRTSNALPPITHTGNNLRPSEPTGSELRTSQGSPEGHRDDHQRPDNNGGTVATNGDHEAMETDLSEPETNNAAPLKADVTAAPDTNCVSPGQSPTPPLSPKSGPESPAYNNAAAPGYNRVSQSSEGGYTYEDSDAWSHPNQSPPSDDDPAACKYRTDKIAERPHNGLPPYTDRNDTEMAAD